MDVHCATCGEPWDTHHLRHDEVHETDAGTQWIYYRLDVEDYEREVNSFSNFFRDTVRELTEENAPKKPEIEEWEGKLTPFWREQFKARGWEFGTSVVAVLHCPFCKSGEELPNAEQRRTHVQVLSDMLEGDEDGQSADNELALATAEG